VIKNEIIPKPLEVDFKAANLLKKALQLTSVEFFVVKLMEANVGLPKKYIFLIKKNGSRTYSKGLKSDLQSVVNILGLVVANAVKISIAASLGFLLSGHAVLKKNVKTLFNSKLVKRIIIYSFLNSILF
jgi:hypothetical protein